MLSQIPSTCETAHVGGAGCVMCGVAGLWGSPLWLLLSLGLGEEPGSARGHTNQIEEGQDANWVEPVAFHWNRSWSTDVQSLPTMWEETTPLHQGMAVCDLLQKNHETREFWGNRGRWCAFIIKTTSLASLVVIVCSGNVEVEASKDWVRSWETQCCSWLVVWPWTWFMASPKSQFTYLWKWD